MSHLKQGDFRQRRDAVYDEQPHTLESEVEQSRKDTQVASLFALKNLPPDQIIEERVERGRVYIALTPVIIALGGMINTMCNLQRPFAPRRSAEARRDPWITEHLKKMERYLENSRKKVSMEDSELVAITDSYRLVQLMCRGLSTAESDFEHILASAPNYGELVKDLQFYFADDVVGDDWSVLSRRCAMGRAFKAFRNTGISAHNIPTAKTQGLSSGPIGLSFLLRAANRVLVQHGVCLHYLPDRSVSVGKIETMSEMPGKQLPVFSISLSPDAQEQLTGYEATYSPEVGAVLFFRDTVEQGDAMSDVLETVGVREIAELLRTFQRSKSPTRAHELRHALNHERYPELSWGDHNGDIPTGIKLSALFSDFEYEFLGQPEDGEASFHQLDELSAFGAGIAAAANCSKDEGYLELTTLLTTFLNEEGYGLCHTTMKPVLFGQNELKDDELPVVQALRRLELCFKRRLISHGDTMITAGMMEHLGELGMERLYDSYVIGNDIIGMLDEPELNT